MAVHALAGPIIHLAHGQPRAAALSFLIEGLAPAAFGAAAVVASRYGLSPMDAVFGYGLLPLIWLGAPVVDSIVLANKPKAVTPAPKEKIGYSLAPLALPKIRASDSAPLGLSLVGKF